MPEPIVPVAERLRRALAAPDASARLRAAFEAGTRPSPAYAEVLVARCAIEPDFSVRDTLTWALIRHPADTVLPLLLDEVRRGGGQGRAQALHTLSKLRDPRGWAALSPELLRDPDPAVARTAWRAAVLLAPAVNRGDVAVALSSQLGRGDRIVRASLARAFAELGEDAEGPLRKAEAHGGRGARQHAIAVRRFLVDPGAGYEAAEFEAEHELVLADARRGPGDQEADGR